MYNTYLEQRSIVVKERILPYALMPLCDRLEGKGGECLKFRVYSSSQTCQITPISIFHFLDLLKPVYHYNRHHQVALYSHSF